MCAGLFNVTDNRRDGNRKTGQARAETQPTRAAAATRDLATGERLAMAAKRTVDLVLCGQETQACRGDLNRRLCCPHLWIGRWELSA